MMDWENGREEVRAASDNRPIRGIRYKSRFKSRKNSHAADLSAWVQRRKL